MTASTEQRETNERTIENIHEFEVGDKSLDELDQYVHDDIVSTICGIDEPIEGIEAYEESIREELDALPDATIEVHERITQGDTVVDRYTVTGTHEGERLGIESTGRTIEVSGVCTYQLEDGKVKAEYAIFDMYGLLGQLGVIDTPV